MPRSILAIVIAVLLAACSSRPYEPIDISTMPAQSLSIVQVATDRKVYKEVERDGDRVPMYASTVAIDSALGLSGSAVGMYVGTLINGVSVEYMLATINPVILAISVVPTVASGVMDGVRVRDAKSDAEPFNELLEHRDTHGEFLETLSGALAQQTTEIELGSAVTMLPEERLDEDYLAGRDTDLVLVVVPFTAFSPNFEVVQVMASYSLYAADEGWNKPISSNWIRVQSEVHGGALAEDTRKEMNLFADAWLERQVSVVRQSSLSRNQIRSQERRLERSADRLRAPSHYTMVDDHDPEGRIWLENDAQRFVEARDEAVVEAAQLLVGDLLDDRTAKDHDRVQPPGFGDELALVPSFSQDQRQVYRLKTGGLVSVPSNSRFVPFLAH